MSLPQRSPRSPSSQSGFTLIEMLVVIAVMGILSSTSVQSYQVYREKVSDMMMSVIMRDFHVALEIGCGDAEEWQDKWNVVPGAGVTVGPGVVSELRSEDPVFASMMPGLVLPRGFGIRGMSYPQEGEFNAVMTVIDCRRDIQITHDYHTLPGQKIVTSGPTSDLC